MSISMTIHLIRPEFSDSRDVTAGVRQTGSRTRVYNDLDSGLQRTTRDLAIDPQHCLAHFAGLSCLLSISCCDSGHAIQTKV